ncbi:MAG: hypothetical protein FWD71_06555 [Oscillospiraceae bacterium]|nr:hypothetical protein [Oscillospiraceae bacterium]
MKMKQDINTNNIERYCTVKESLIESCKEMMLIRQGKLKPKRDWRTMFAEIEAEAKAEEEKELNS